MKKKKSMIVLVILVAILVLGIGYAIVSDVNLTISGTLSTPEEALDVVISAATPNAAATGDPIPAHAFGTVTAPAGLTATITALLDTVGASGQKTVTYTIKNNETDVDALVTLSSIKFGEADSDEYFTCTTSLGSGITVPAGSTATFTVTVGLQKMPIESTDATKTVTVTLNAKAQAKA